MLDERVSLFSRQPFLSCRFDIFKITSDGHPIWVETSESLSRAMRRASALRKNGPDARYMIFRHDTQEKIFMSR